MVGFLALATAGAVHAQPIGEIGGVVVDSVSGAMLEEATVSLFAGERNLTGNQTAGRVSAVRRSGPKGFLFRGLAAGRYILVSTYLGYRPDTLRFTVAEGNPSARVRLKMRRGDNPMMEVVVTAHIPPAIVRHDTIAFNAAAYPTQPHATLEDLLRKLPGIDIDKDGNVTMQGKKVDRIYLDGKEFFLDDPRTATQNLPADLIDQVEAFDSQTDKARMTGIKESTGTKSINIRLKRNRRKGFFGKLYAGTGTGAAADPASATGSYSAGGNGMLLGKTMLLAAGNLNNLNNQFTGKENRNGPGTNGIRTLHDAKLILRHEAGIFSYTFDGGSNGDRTDVNSLAVTQTTLIDSSLLSNRSNQAINSAQNWYGNGLFSVKPDGFRQIEWRSNWSARNGTGREMDSTAVSTLKNSVRRRDNQGLTVNNSRNAGFNGSNSLNFRQRWRRPGRTLFIGLTESHSSQRQPETTFSVVDNFDTTGRLSGTSNIDQSLLSTGGSNAYGANIGYTEPIRSGHLLDWSYRVDRTANRSDRSSADFDTLTGKYDLPDAATTNHFKTTNTIQRLGMGYNATNGKLQYQLGLALQFSALDNVNRSTDSTLRLRQTNWYPRVMLIYTPGKGKSLNLRYSATTTSPSVQQLQPVADPTNPFLIRLGNPDLDQELTHLVSLNFNSFNSRSFQNWQMALDGSYSEQAIVPSTKILAGGIQEREYVNAGGVWSMAASLSYGLPLSDQKKGNASISLNGQYNRGVSFANGIQQVAGSPDAGLKGKVNLHPTESMFLEATGSADITATRYSADPGQNTVSWSQHYTLDASYLLPGAVTVSTYYSLQLTSGTLPAPAVSLWNAGAWKEIGRKRQFQLRFSAFGLLNNSRNISQTIGPGTLTTTETNIPGRIFLLSLVWHFSKFPGNGT